jgi:hypothetical protein
MHLGAGGYWEGCKAGSQGFVWLFILFVVSSLFVS